MEFVRSAIREPRMLLAPARQQPWPGSVSVHASRIWAFSDSAYTLVDLAKAKLEFNKDKKDTAECWMGLRFEEQDVYTLPSGRARNIALRAAQRDPILRPYTSGCGIVGMRFSRSSWPYDVWGTVLGEIRRRGLRLPTCWGSARCIGARAVPTRELGSDAVDQ